MTHDEAIELIQAQKDEKTIEYYTSAMSDTKWRPVRDFNGLIRHIYGGSVLRIKPEPVIVRGWMNVVKHGDGMCYLYGLYQNYDTAQRIHYVAPSRRIDTIEITYEVKQ